MERYRNWCLAIGVMFTIGCSPKLYDVQGIVRYEDGVVVDGAIVEFVPSEGTGVGRGKTDKEGNFQLQTAGEIGVPKGEYSVGIVKIVVMDGFQDHLRHSGLRSIAKEYQNPETSGITISIPTDEPIEFVVKDNSN